MAVIRDSILHLGTDADAVSEEDGRKRWKHKSRDRSSTFHYVGHCGVGVRTAHRSCKISDGWPCCETRNLLKTVVLGSTVFFVADQVGCMWTFTDRQYHSFYHNCSILLRISLERWLQLLLMVRLSRRQGGVKSLVWTRVQKLIYSCFLFTEREMFNWSVVQYLYYLNTTVCYQYMHAQNEMT